MSHCGYSGVIWTPFWYHFKVTTGGTGALSVSQAFAFLFVFSPAPRQVSLQKAAADMTKLAKDVVEKRMHESDLYPQRDQILKRLRVFPGVHCFSSSCKVEPI